jgi:hypothetical protein
VCATPFNFSDKPDVGFFWDSLKVGSWNIMGMPWLPFRAAAIENIPYKKYDVLHLQEVWSPADQNTIIADAKKHGFRHHYLPTIRQGANGCDLTNPAVKQYAEFFVGCLVTQTVPGPINTQQVVQPYPYPMNYSCAEVAIGLSLGAGGYATPQAGQLCFSCLLNAMQELPNGPSAFGALAVCGQQQGKLYFNGGVNGQLIISKHKIENVVESPLVALQANRINIYATIKNIRFGFGHWAFNVLADYGPFGDYQYGATGIDHAKDFLAHNPDVILGDFNSGVNYQPAGYEFLLANGYKDLIKPQPVETWCQPDSLDFPMCVLSGSYSGAIDHILLKNDRKLSSCSSGVFNNKKPVLSDHVGVGARINKLWFTSKKLQNSLKWSL